MTVRLMDLDAMVRSVEINRSSPHAMFLGAGASLTSGIPSAGACILQWKRKIFETRNPELKSAVSEISLPSVQKRIDDWLESSGLWPKPGIDDYGFFIEKCLPIVEDRRRFFQSLVKDGKPHVGYKVLALLAEDGLVRSVWTTNFDGMVAKAISAVSSVSPIEVGIDCQGRVIRQPNKDELLCVSLHGDYRYDQLKNTEEELRVQEAELAKQLTKALESHSLIVSGYSGRDHSIMRTLENAIVNTQARGNIFWCGFSERPDANVEVLLHRAHQAGREAFYVPEVTFDELMSRLGRQCLPTTFAARFESIVGSVTATTVPLKSSFTLKIEKPTALIKGNLFPLVIPAEAYSFSLNEWPDSKVWKWLRQLSMENGFLAVPLKKNVLAFGTIDQIKNAFGDRIDGDIERTPIATEDFRFADGSIHHLVQESLIQSIASSLNLSTDGKYRLWERKATERKAHNGMSYDIYKSAVIDLRLVNSKLHIAIDPTFFATCPNEQQSAEECLEVVKSKLGYQHNTEYDEDLKHWLSVIAGNKKPLSSIDFDFPNKTGAFRFKLNLLPSFAEIDEGKSSGISIAENHRPLVKFHGRLQAEPFLHFATEAGWNPARDTLPLRGLSEHGPFDAVSVRLSPQPAIRLSVICPKPEAKSLYQFLSTYNQSVPALRQGEYMVDYKGFENTFRCPLIVPDPSSDNWGCIPEISNTVDSLAACREWTQNVCEALNSVAAMNRSVVLIASPTRWNRFRVATSETETFNVHDDVKAFAVRKGVATQFLDQDTWSPYDRSRIWWWLSLAIYTKAMRTPWVLQSLDPDSAFVGLGYSLDHQNDSTKKIVVGCSHIYNAQGQGLQFRLRNIVDATVRRDRNPYLSFNEARQMGETIRQLFWESHYRLPERVVIHKLFPFLKDEIKGIKAGLNDIRSIELLEINHEPSLRFLNSKFKNGKFEIDGYPVRRGTTVKISNDELLLWVHGATDGVMPGRPYFQGKRRIPGPVVVRRYAGTSDVTTIVNEILGLSKMDWNSGDLYAQLPATVKSSQAIAKIGRRLAAVGSASYDYRLFM